MLFRSSHIRTNFAEFIYYENPVYDGSALACVLMSILSFVFIA